MSWFRKSSSASAASQHNPPPKEKHKQHAHSATVNSAGEGEGGGDGHATMSLGALLHSCIEVVDPEDFFHDPAQVLAYKEEETFLNIMSEWEIVDHPSWSSGGNYFSADFEDELLQLKTQDATATASASAEVGISAAQYQSGVAVDVAACDNRCETEIPDLHRHWQLQQQQQVPQRGCNRKLYALFFAEHIQTGIALPTRRRSNKAMHKRKPRANAAASVESNLNTFEAVPCASMETMNEELMPPEPHRVVKDCALDRCQLKTEALACSIMGAIGKCPDKDGTPRSSAYDLSQPEANCHAANGGANSHCDHYDIKQFFRLDDNGNILLNIGHIEECRGFGFAIAQNRRLYRRYLREVHSADETYCQRRARGRGCFGLLKHLLRLLWQYLTGHPRNKINPYGAGPGDSVRAYTLQLALDQSSTFARNIENFISCTKESREAAPQVVMRNMRQFMNGMKNYLVKHGEGKFQQEVETARSRLKSDEFLNLDAILETVMHQLVVLPLREHLYGMFVDYYTRSGDIQLLAENVKYACGRCPADFGIRATVAPPTSSSLHAISNLLLRLQEAELPLDKLELFLCVIATISDATGCPRGQQLGADDFLPILVYVVAKCGFVGAEIEAEFMWGLLQPTLLNGEPGYYLTALCSAVHVLKSFMASESESGTASLDWRSSSLPACSSVLRVIIPDECNGSLQTRTLPVRPHTTTREVCRIIAHKARITNPQDYALFKLVDGEETLLSDVECPQDIRLAAKGKHCMLAYKRIDAKIAWPTAAQPVFN